MPEQSFLTESADYTTTLDRLMGVVMALAAEVYILRDRNEVLEAILTEAGVLQPDALENYQLSPQARQTQIKERDAFVARVLSPILGQETKEAQS